MFPIMLQLKGRPCLVVGGGGVALRKALSLVEEGARVKVVAPEAVESLEHMAADGRITLEKRPYRPGEVIGNTLVFTATDSREVNRQVYEDAHAAGIWVNAADEPESCSFHLSARIQRDPLQLTVASGGEAPFAVRRLRQLLERRFGPEWAEWLEAASRFRSRVREMKLRPEQAEDCFDRFFEATVDRDRIAARVPSVEEETGWAKAAFVDEEEGSAALEAQPPAPSEGKAAAGPGLVSLVGSGPGCAGLLTVRGWQRLMAADVVVYDRLAAQALPCELPADVELHCVGKTAGNHPVPQQEINAQLVRLAHEGKRVVRLKGGDPYVFGRGGEELEELQAEGIPYEVVPGVTSGIAAPGWAGIPVTYRGEAVRVTLLTAHESTKHKGPQMRWDLLAQDPHATLVGYMGVTTLPSVVNSLVEAGMDPHTPAALVERGTTAAQRSVVTTLEDLPAAVTREGLKPPALFVIGPTVRHAERLDWFGRQPLAGERLVVSAEAPGLARDLEAAGAEVVVLPEPMTPASRVVVGAAPLTGCVLLSAADAEWLDEEREGQGWEESMAVWCMGPETANRARELGWHRVQQVDPARGSEGLVGWIKKRRRGLA
jgi:uroporphyrin-III C-methyltransferase/precorrin-2 dehydrogenase/sirohydrochlorin ferrochelatase